MSMLAQSDSNTGWQDAWKRLGGESTYLDYLQKDVIF